VGVVVLGALAAWKLGCPRSRPSLLLVTLDTVRADHVGAYGYREATTPHLDALAARGTRFAAAQSASPLTAPSHATILTGLYPPIHGVRDNSRFRAAEGVPTLAERLRGAGFETAAFVGAFPLAAAFGFGRGFQQFDEGLRPSAAPGGIAERPANEVADAAVDWLRARGGGRFFAWVHFFDPHEPYAPPEEYRRRFASPYDGEIAFADAQLGRLLETLRSGGRLEDTLVLVLADHGEGLGDHGESTHGLLLYESTLRIPLVIAGPGVPAGRVVGSRVGTVDVLPTLMKLLGLEAPAGLPGRDLTPGLAGRSLRDEPLFAESLYGRLNCGWAPLRGLTEGDWKLVEGGGKELFDLARDPEERDDRAGQEPERTARLEDALRRALSAMAPGGDRAQPARLSADQAERLRSLGYVAAGGGGGPLDAPGLPDPRQKRQVFERLRRLGGATETALGASLAEVVRIGDEEPGNPLAQDVLAGLALRAGRLDLAARALARYLDLEPGRVEVRTRYGSLLRTLGRLEEAERELRRALAEGGEEEVVAGVALAETLLARGRVEEADALLGAVLTREPRHRAALLARGRLRLRQGRSTEAAADLEAAASGGDAEALLELAELHARRGEVEAQAAAAERVLASSPAHPWALALLGQARVAEGRGEEGEALLQQAVRAGPRRSVVWLRLAAGFEAAGQADLARRCRAAAAAPGEGRGPRPAR
jgi:tetratricopeptide (TPR) repeat protein